MKLSYSSDRSKAKEYLISVVAIIAVSLICYMVSDLIGYRTVALILLFTVSLLAIVFSVYPVLVAAVLSALIWDFFFIPPHFTIHVERAEDVLMLFMYLIIALLNGILTSRIRHLKKQARQKEQRLQALKLYNTLFNSISHELRTPLTTILGAAGNLTSESKNISDEDRIFLSNQILIASTQLNRLVDNLLSMSRLESGMLRPKLDWCDISELIHNVVDRLKPEMKQYPVNISIPENIPVMKLDLGLTEQALYNILHNIPVHTPAGTSVDIHADYTNNELILTITDDGPGFNEGELDMVFEKFYHTRVSGKGGLGLGLSITRGFIQAQNGSITVANEKPHGAVFSIRIPVETAQIETENE